ncbi:MAG: leucine--tRNA ligase [Bacteroidia bacterium]|nr:MAG: leucine--tRNA ligase [Bacteroidia bacterium]
MAEHYQFGEIEAKWQARWEEQGVYRVPNASELPKYYVLDMFPYPSGAGLHVGHPLGYIASDIYSRYKRLRGFNVLHPMGYDAFGLPAEQYAIQTGQHPAVTTAENVARYERQLRLLGLGYDWGRQFKTSDPDYYHWTQWAFLRMFAHYYDTKADRAQPIDRLEAHFAAHGSQGHTAHGDEPEPFTAADWQGFSPARREEVLQHFRLAFRAETMVNWCEQLGTVLANDEVKEGLSVRGGYPVVQKRMMQWCLRVSAYAERLLEGLNRLEWTDSLKQMQRNWIGRSEGASVHFPIEDDARRLEVFTTRPDTIYGVTFMVLAPEHEWVGELTSPEQRAAVEEYQAMAARRSERERQAETRQATGVFIGRYAIHPFSGERIPIWISEYVLSGYGTGAIMAVPAHDSRDFLFARTFGLPITQVVSPRPGEASDPAGWTDSFDAKEGYAINSPGLDGMPTPAAITAACAMVEQQGVGRATVTYRLRDAIFSRQRYWGEPIPIYYRDGVPCPLPEDELPLLLPEVDKFLPTAAGDPPLARAKNWVSSEGHPLETSTMPGFAGSSAYYLRYMDPHNAEALVDRRVDEYWRDVDLYIGGTEHATGHLIYSRFWNKFLYDLGHVCEDEPFKKLINQGMIQGRSSFIYRVKGTNRFVPASQAEQHDTTPIHVDVNLVHNDVLDIAALREWNAEYRDAEFVLDENGEYRCGWAIEKMSKSMYNVVNPDMIIGRYGADTLRMYEMFLGPLEQSKPWDTNGIDGVFKFLRRLWTLHVQAPLEGGEPSPAELKALHTAIKSVTEGIESFGFNTCISALMVCLNELQSLGCRKRAILEPLLVVLCPFAPHIAEELWARMGNEGFVVQARWPELNEAFLAESSFECPVSFNGKTRFTLSLAKDLPPEEVERLALAAPEAQRYLEGKTVRKVVVVPNRIVNIVVS